MPITRVETEITGRKLSIETGKIAKQADGAVWVQMGGTIVMVTAVSSRESKPYGGFFPLTVDYRERAYAAGRIPGGFFKREGRPYEHEVLNSRIIDRPLRPMFPDDYNCETQVLASVISYDNVNEPAILGVIGASAAVAISDIPIREPFGAIRIGYINDEYVINPTVTEKENAELDIIIAGTGEDIVMVEGEASEISEEIILGALKVAMSPLKKIFELQKELIEKAGKPKREYEPVSPPEGLQEAITEFAAERINGIIGIPEKIERGTANRALMKETIEKFEEQYPDSESFIANAVYELEKKAMRRMILSDGKRIDGRGGTDIRKITSEVGILPMVHGSALFTRGETQALAVLTLGTKLDEQKIEDLEGESFRSFILHYNFPSFSVGETSRRFGPGRREIGHGHLAERALTPVIPVDEAFPYTIRIVSDILESNGSSSMASVCASSLALMDAGAPIKTPVAGIAMGLVKEGDEYVILSDIMGTEDHYGDMDFKVAGTKDGITAFQMDIKVPGIPSELMEKALHQAKDGRAHILSKMAETLDKPNAELSPYAPRIVIIKIKPGKIGDVIGGGGKTIRAIQEETSTTIAIEDDGTVFISSVDAEGMEKAVSIIESITHEPKVNEIFDGTVTRVTNFGAFVRLTPAIEGLLHISEIEHRRIDRVEDVLNVGDTVKVKVLDIDIDSGKIRLSRKVLLERTGSSGGRRHETRRDDGNRGNRR